MGEREYPGFPVVPAHRQAGWRHGHASAPSGGLHCLLATLRCDAQRMHEDDAIGARDRPATARRPAVSSPQR
ncbi:hypothetical protein FHT12_003558 [Xanthomonas campestris]|nr:hypothetical protein [Xanthomonas euroxanthea]PPT31469.1 hypothetical protein XaCFBP7622_09735 [Xanthomonas arboricola]